MSRYTVSLAGLADLVERMALFDRAVEARLAQVDAVARSLAARWTGQAAASYATAHAECVRDVDEMRGAVARLRTAVATAHSNYSSAVAANTRMWG